MSARAILRDERGASLLLALAFLTFMSVFCVSILAFTGVGATTSRAVADDIDERYAADAGMEYGIGNLAADSSKCASSGATYTWPSISDINGRTVTYGCTYESGGVAQTGSPLMGEYGTIITGTNGISYADNNADNLTIAYEGSVHSEGTVSFGYAEQQTMAIDGNLTVSGSCPDSANLRFTSPGSCTEDTSEPSVSAMTLYVPNASAATSTSSGGCTTLYPGKYGSGFRAIPSFSSSGRYYLASGVYYITSGTMTLQGTVFGGAQGSDTKLVTSTSPCRASDPSGTGYSGSGVTFILGGGAQLRVSNSATEVELFTRVPGGLDAAATPGIGIWSGSSPTRAPGSGTYTNSTASTPFATNHVAQDVVIHGLTHTVGTSSTRGQVQIRVHTNAEASDAAVFLGGLVATRLQVTGNSSDDDTMTVAGSGGFSASPRVVSLTSTATDPDGGDPTTITARVQPDSSTPVVSEWRVS